MATYNIVFALRLVLFFAALGMNIFIQRIDNVSSVSYQLTSRKSNPTFVAIQTLHASEHQPEHALQPYDVILAQYINSDVAI